MGKLRALSLRTIAIVVAVLLAAVATFALVDYVRGVEADAAKEAEIVEAFVAKGSIQAGTPVQVAMSQGLIDRAEVPKTALPAGAVTRLDQIDGLVTSSLVLEGEILQRGRFAAANTSGATLDIPDESVAMSVEVGIPPGVAGFIDPGDLVAILVNAEIPEDGTIPAEGTEVATTEDKRRPTVQFLLQGVEVLAVGQRVTVTVDGQPQDTVQRSDGSMLMTLALTPTQAEQLAFAQFHGDLYFTLLPDSYEDTGPFTTGGRTFQNLFE